MVVGHNHRMNLSTFVLIKENHIRAVGSIDEAIERAKKTSLVLLRLKSPTSKKSKKL
jgi:nicotinate-nucleotide pyrophosphorylase